MSVDTITVPKFDASGNLTGQTETFTHVNPVAKELDLHIDVKGVADAATLVAVPLATTEEAAEANGSSLDRKSVV